MNVPFNKLMEKQDAEFFQVALLALVKKNGGSMSFTERELLDAYKLVGSVDRVNEKYVIKTSVKPADFNETAAAEYFDEAKRNASNKPSLS